MDSDPIDWTAIDADIDTASARTDEALASRISSVSRLTDAEVQSMFPKAADAKKLLELMQIVQDGTDTTERANRLVANIESLGGVVVTLLGKFVA